jgi:hypothetical protein
MFLAVCMSLILWLPSRCTATCTANIGDVNHVASQLKVCILSYLVFDSRLVGVLEHSA